MRPDIAAEWHPTKNAPTTAADVNPGSKKPRWWLCGKCALSISHQEPGERMPRRGNGVRPEKEQWSKARGSASG
ncbi:zinc-ribbon domain-containing protein [Mycolicibacterium sp. TY81]|uniref:zinc-ribbon domain-containing protein n=1 Tax=Mycolicibacterium sp. TY81 TaxID=2759662 RepID=UPI0035300149